MTKRFIKSLEGIIGEEPLKRFHHNGWGGGVCITVWKDGPFYNFTINKYYSRDKVAQTTSTLSPVDLACLQPLITEAIRWINEQAQFKRDLPSGEEFLAGLPTELELANPFLKKR